MADYAIGDVQGCRAALEDLLEKLRFDPSQDRLWFAGDLVARGPDSLGTLRLIYSLRDVANSVLGNHDLHLLAVRHDHSRLKNKDGTGPIFSAEDGDTLLDWLQQRPLLLELPEQHLMTHAGIPPWWSVKQLRALSQEAEQLVHSSDAATHLAGMYGNDPALWRDDLQGDARLRVIINALTRMRLILPDGRLDFSHKESLETAPAGMRAWFQIPNPGLEDYTVLFGHWAALLGRTNNQQFIGLDSGCVWGNHLTAYCLQDGQLTHSRQGLR